MARLRYSALPKSTGRARHRTRVALRVEESTSANFICAAALVADAPLVVFHLFVGANIGSVA